MKAARPARWALSFADLCLLLLGFFVLLQARPNGQRLAAGFRAAFGARETGDLDAAAARLFLPGEAILRPAARATLHGYARGGGVVRVVSRGTDPGTGRFDAWELAAARAAAVARALAQAGVAEDRITIDLEPGDGRGQRIVVGRR